MMKKDITALFCIVDDFCKIAEEMLNDRSLPDVECRKPTRVSGLSISEIVTIILLYYQSPCKNFEYFYKSYLQQYKEEFKRLLSYNRFIELKPRALEYLLILLQWYCAQSRRTGISYVDSTPLAVCSNKRIYRHKVFAGIARLGKTTKGWFYGLKLHLVINDYGELISFKFTKGNVDDREPLLELTRRLSGLLFGDKGYISKSLFEEFFKRGLKLVTGIKNNMQNKLLPLFEKLLLRKRSVIESVFDILKNHFELEHSRHRSIWNALVHFVATLIAYSMKVSKPSIKHNFLIPN